MISASYCEHIMALFEPVREINPSFQLMQDGAPCHTSRTTMEALFASGISLIVWPSYSPDLNLIGLWNTMKKVNFFFFIQAYYPKIKEGKQIPQ